MAVVGIRRRVENAAWAILIAIRDLRTKSDRMAGRVAVCWFWAVLPYCGRGFGAGVRNATKMPGNACLVGHGRAPFWHPVPKQAEVAGRGPRDAFLRLPVD
jgi:hypothetical protein